MKFPWFSSENSSEKKTKPIQENKEEELKKTYELSSLPDDLQKIAILLNHTEKEIIYLKKKLMVASSVKNQLEKKLFREIKELNP